MSSSRAGWSNVEPISSLCKAGRYSGRWPSGKCSNHRVSKLRRRDLQIDAVFLTLTCKSKETAVRITSKGQVTIPAKIRERAGLLPQTEVEFEFDGKVVRIRRAKARKGDGRGARLVAHLRGRGDVAMSTDAIMALTRDD